MAEDISVLLSGPQPQNTQNAWSVDITNCELDSLLNCYFCFKKLVSSANTSSKLAANRLQTSLLLSVIVNVLFHKRVGIKNFFHKKFTSFWKDAIPTY